MKELKVIASYAFSLESREWKLLKRILTQMHFQDGVTTFNHFLRNGLIEYLDVNEENNALVRFFPNISCLFCF